MPENPTGFRAQIEALTEDDMNGEARQRAAYEQELAAIVDETWTDFEEWTHTDPYASDFLGNGGRVEAISAPRGWYLVVARDGSDTFVMWAYRMSRDVVAGVLDKVHELDAREPA